jgi:hypothetical protein
MFQGQTLAQGLRQIRESFARDPRGAIIRGGRKGSQPLRTARRLPVTNGLTEAPIRSALGHQAIFGFVDRQNTGLFTKAGLHSACVS